MIALVLDLEGLETANSTENVCHYTCHILDLIILGRFPKYLDRLELGVSCRGAS